jgi:hypothetical protein
MTPEEPPIESSPAGISRRRVLKRIGTGAAIAWSAPILTSIRTPSFAQSAGCSCGPFDCSNPTPPLCDNGCLCSNHHGGGACVCWTSGFCSGIGQNLCNVDQDCVNQFGPGFECIDINSSGCNSICGGDTTACVDTSLCGGTRSGGPNTGIKPKA